MKRRNFIITTGLASMSLGMKTIGIKKEITTAGDIHEYLRGLYSVRENSVDQIIIGDPDTKIKKVGTCWMGYSKPLKQHPEKDESQICFFMMMNSFSQ